MSPILAMLLAAVAAACLAFPATSGARDPIIPAGAHVAGVPVGGLPLSGAALRLDSELGAPLRSPVRVRAAGHRRALTARAARLRFDPLRSARRANIAAHRAGRGGVVDVDPWTAYSHRRVRAFVRRLAGRVSRPARDARLRFAVTRLKVRRARAGRGIDGSGLRERIEAALKDPAAPRVLRAALRRLEPEVRRADLARRDRTVVTVHRRGFRLRVFKGLERVASHGVAVGMPGHATPRGRFRIANKAVDPAWSAPDRPWAGAYRNELVPGASAENPLKARWLGIVDGVGIHGTNATWSLGNRASHGCIRMSIPAVKRVYRLIPVGATVLIK